MAVTLLAESVIDVEDATTGFLFRGTSSPFAQSLPIVINALVRVANAPHHYSIQLIAFHLANDAPAATHTLLQRVLMASAHHPKNAQEISPVADLLRVARQFAVVSKSAHLSSALNSSVWNLN